MVRTCLVSALGVIVLGLCAPGCGDDGSSEWIPWSDAASPEAAADAAVSKPDSSTADASGDSAGVDSSDAGGAEVDVAPPPPPKPLAPCAQGKCWQTDLFPNACSYAANDEDFSSGKYNVHAYATRIHADSVMDLSLTNTSGTWQPALILARQDGTVVYDGEVGLLEPGLTVTSVTSGRTGGTAQFKVESASTWDGTLFVTGWEVVDSGFVDFLPTDAKYHVESESACKPVQPGQGIAPAGALAGEQPLGTGSVSVSTSTSPGTAYRIDAKKGEHIGFRYDFTPTGADVVMEILRWNGTAATSLAKTDSGTGFRVLAVLDADEDRTYWARLSGATSSGTLVAKRTPFEEGGHCNNDCDRLLQMPLPNDPAKEGYDLSGATYREQFGRRDLLMFTRYAGRAVVKAKMNPFSIHDLSNWDGSAPPGHASHDLGKDVDYSLYSTTGEAGWSSLCTVNSETNCVAGTGGKFGAVYMARLLAPVFESGRVEYAFLDQEFHAALFAAASDLAAKGEIDSALIPVFKDVVTHWPNHHHHVHLRVHIEAY